VLEALQREPATPFALRALEHAARAASAFYAAEAAEVGSAPLKDALRTALCELSHALGVLQEAPRDWAPARALSEHLARALSVVHPVAQPVSRRRRPVLLPGAVPNRERRALAALGDGIVGPRDPTRVAGSRTGATSEHRRDTRVMIDVDVGLLSDSNFYTGLAEDVSRGGVFVGTARPLPPGTRVLLFFVLSGGKTVKAEGEVRWLRSGDASANPGMGVAFTALGEEQRRAIEAFCGERPAMFHE
jgi:uncharacterized protein (TIGR02266 family)